MADPTMHEATFRILTALAEGSRHGHGIMADVDSTSTGRVRLLAGTLDGTLDPSARTG